MDTRFLESLVAVVETGSIAAAARAQGLTAAAVNQRLRALEVELGDTLFRRAGKTVMPTSACLRLLPYARKIAQDAKLLSMHMDESGLNTELKVGVISTVMLHLIPDTLVKLKKSAPNITLNISRHTSHVLYDQLEAGDLDVAVMIEPPFALPKSLQSFLLRQEPLMYAGPKGSAASMKTALHELPYIRYAPTSWGGRLAERFLKDNDISVDLFCTIGDFETAARMVGSGLGVTLLTDWCGRKGLALDVDWVPILGPEYQRKIILMQHREAAKEKALAAFSVKLRETLQEAT